MLLWRRILRTFLKSIITFVLGAVDIFVREKKIYGLKLQGNNSRNKLFRKSKYKMKNIFS